MLLRNARLHSGGPLVTIETSGAGVVSITPGASSCPVGDDLDVDGNLVIPGLTDAHAHLAQWAIGRRRIDLSGAQSARHAAAMMALAAAPDEADTVLVGYGFRDALWPDSPAPGLLDWAGEYPVALISADLHAVWLNPAALRVIGHPGDNGILRESDAMTASKALSQVDPATMDEWVREALAAAAARGVTAVRDFEFADNVTDWTRRGGTGALACHINAAVYPKYLDAAIAAGLATGQPLPGTAGLVTTGPLKLFVDGSLNTRTALCHDPYQPPAEGVPACGLQVTATDELVDLMRRANTHGIRPAVHAIGDRANAIALDAYDEVGCPGSIEHAQLIDWVDLPRLARPGLTLGVQPAHLLDDVNVAEQYWAGRTDRSYAFADLLRAGARLEFGSDAPVSPLDPWRSIAAAVFRSAGDGQGWHTEQAIPVAEALFASTGWRRKIAVGDGANLVVLGADPASLAAGDLARMPVLATMAAGSLTFRSS